MDKELQQFYEFGKFRLDAVERRLWRDGRFVPLPPKAFDMLLTLVRNSGHLLTREELLKTIWMDTFVDENNLRQYVSLLRKTLNGDGEELIETVPRLGYRFLGEVRHLSEPPAVAGGFSGGHYAGNQNGNGFAIKEKITETPKFGRRKLIYLAMALGVTVLISLIGFSVKNRQQTENQPPQMRGTMNKEAYEDYVQGRALWQTRNGENLYKAMLLLESAVRKDPNFALAHAALADAYAFDYGNWKKAETEAREAIRLDANLGEPHATIGFVRMFWEWKLKSAENEFRQSVALSPNYATAHQWYAANLAAQGSFNEALVEIKRAQELEPDSPSVNADMCQIFYFARRYDEAQAQCQKTLGMNPDFLSAHRNLYEIYIAKEMWNEAVNSYFKAEELTNVKPPSAGSLEKLREAYARGGIRAFWRGQIEQLRPSSERDCYALARLHARLDEKDKAIFWLEKARKNRVFDFVFVLSDPIFYDLHYNQDFRNLIADFNS